VTLAPETVAALAEAERRRSRWGNIALWVIAMLLVVLVIELS
jgi:predicted nucleic acid-binding Zn ribbon protein